MATTADSSLTAVRLRFEDFRCNYRLVLGSPVAVDVLEDRPGLTRETAFFPPGAIFGLDLWEPNRVGKTLRWRSMVLQAGHPGQVLTEVPQVHPGARVLMQADGARECKALLAWLRELASEGDPAALPAMFFEGQRLWFQSTKAGPRGVPAVQPFEV